MEPVEDEDPLETGDEEDSESPVPEASKKGRGRPPKNGVSAAAKTPYSKFPLLKS